MASDADKTTSESNTTPTPADWRETLICLRAADGGYSEPMTAAAVIDAIQVVAMRRSLMCGAGGGIVVAAPEIAAHVPGGECFHCGLTHGPCNGKCLVPTPGTADAHKETASHG